MSVLQALILSLAFAKPATSCHSFVGLGKLERRQDQIVFVTHSDSQEEKVWPLSTESRTVQLELAASLDTFVRVQGVLHMTSDKGMKVESLQNVVILRSVEAFEKSRSASAVAIGTVKKCEP